jgi:hypothetical protein
MSSGSSSAREERDLSSRDVSGPEPPDRLDFDRIGPDEDDLGVAVPVVKEGVTVELRERDLADPIGARRPKRPELADGLGGFGVRGVLEALDDIECGVEVALADPAILRGADDGLDLASGSDLDGGFGERPQFAGYEEARLDAGVVGMAKEPDERLRLGDLGVLRQRDGVPALSRRKVILWHGSTFSGKCGNGLGARALG